MPATQDDEPESTRTAWQTLSSEIVYDTPWIKVRRDEVLNHLGKSHTFSIAEIHRPSVFIVAMNDANEILMQREFRYSVKQTVWDVPAGYNDGEEPVEAARRELLEEAGLESDDWTRLGRLYSALGVANFPFDVFLARGVRMVTDERDEDEEIIEQRFMDIATIEAMQVNGTLVSAAAIAAVNLARLHLAKLEQTK